MANPPAAYEQADARFSAGAKALAGLIAGLAISHCGLWFLLRSQLSTPREVDTPRFLTAAPIPRLGPPLQPVAARDRTPADDAAAMWRDDDRVFEAMGFERSASPSRWRVPDAILDRVRSAPTTRPATRGVPR